MAYRLKITSAFDLANRMNTARVKYPQFIYLQTQAPDAHLGLFVKEQRYIVSVTGEGTIAEFEKIKDYLISNIEQADSLKIEFDKL